MDLENEIDFFHKPFEEKVFINYCCKGVVRSLDRQWNDGLEVVFNRLAKNFLKKKKNKNKKKRKREAAEKEGDSSVKQNGDGMSIEEVEGFKQVVMYDLEGVEVDETNYLVSSTLFNGFSLVIQPTSSDPPLATLTVRINPPYLRSLKLWPKEQFYVGSPIVATVQGGDYWEGEETLSCLGKKYSIKISLDFIILFPL